MTARVALYAGSFDPVTFGHLDVIRAAARLCDRLVVAVGTHATKRPLLGAAARVALIRAEAGPAVAAAGAELAVEGFEGLAVAMARKVGATIVVRGLRGSADLDDEMSMAGMNAAMAPDVQTVFVPAAPGSRFVSATLVRQIAAMGGDVSAFVPPGVAAALRASSA